MRRLRCAVRAPHLSGSPGPHGTSGILRAGGILRLQRGAPAQRGVIARGLTNSFPTHLARAPAQLLARPSDWVCSAALGLYLNPRDPESAETLLTRILQAMYTNPLPPRAPALGIFRHLASERCRVPARCRVFFGPARATPALRALFNLPAFLAAVPPPVLAVAVPLRWVA
jgi:hypothetical protein